MAQQQTVILQRTSASAQDRANKLWARTNVTDDVSSDAFVSRMSDDALRFRRASAERSLTYLSRYEGAVTGEAVSTEVNAGQIAEELRGVDVKDVYSRPLSTARIALSEGKLYAEATQLGLQRLLAIVDTDLTLAQNTAAAEHLPRRSRVVGYRRTLDGDACALCSLASTQRYNRETLQPIHDHCHCGVMPIIGTTDPGRVIDKELAGRVKDELGLTTKPNPQSAYKKFVQVTPHGELGSVLSLKR
jgi:hypothetical protein